VQIAGSGRRSGRLARAARIADRHPARARADLRGRICTGPVRRHCRQRKAGTAVGI